MIRIGLWAGLIGFLITVAGIDLPSLLFSPSGSQNTTARKQQEPVASLSVAHAASATQQSSTEELVRIFMSADLKPRDRRKTRELLHHRIIGNPEMLVEAPSRLIIRHPNLFDSRWLDMLFHHLESGTSERAASSVLAIIAIHAIRPEVTQDIVSRLSAALDHPYASWWAAHTVSKIARSRPGLVDDTMVNRLFALLKDPDSDVIASDALATTALKTTDSAVVKEILARSFSALANGGTAEIAAYTIFKIAEKKPHLITHRQIVQLFDSLNRHPVNSTTQISLAAIAVFKEKQTAHHVADALAAIARSTPDKKRLKTIVTSAFVDLDHKNTVRMAFYLLFRIAQTCPAALEAEHIHTLFAMLQNDDFALFASDVISAMIAHTEDPETVKHLLLKTLSALEVEKPSGPTLNIIARAVQLKPECFDMDVQNRLYSIVRKKDFTQSASHPLIQIAKHTTDRRLAGHITDSIMRRFNSSGEAGEAAKLILKIVREKARLLLPHVEALLLSLTQRPIHKEISYSLYYALLSGDKNIRQKVSRFIENHLSKPASDPNLSDSLLRFAQTVSYELDRLHYFDPTNSKMRKMMQKLPDELLYLVLAQGVEGYITTFKEAHREFKHRKFGKIYGIDDQADNTRMWPQFKTIDSQAIYLGDLLYAYSAKGHLGYIIPSDMRARRDMVDTSVDLIDEISDTDEVKKRGTLLAETITQFLHHAHAGEYTRGKLLQSYRKSMVRTPKRIIFEALIFKNRNVVEQQLTAIEKKEIFASGNYFDYSRIPDALNQKSQQMFIYFSDTQKGYLARMIDYYTGQKTLFIGDATIPHPHLKTIHGFAVEPIRSTPGVTNGITADRILGMGGHVRVVLIKTLPLGNRIEFVISNRIDDLHEAADDTSYTAYGFAGHSSENWQFRDIMNDQVSQTDRQVWVYDGSCGSARHVTRVVKNRNMYLFSNLETGRGPVNQIQIYYIAHYLASGRFVQWHDLKTHMINMHAGYTSKLFYPGNPADNVLKNFIENINRLEIDARTADQG